MTVTEIILIIAGFACICVSFFVAKKRGSASIEGTGETASSDVWTERDEKVIREHIDEMLQDRQLDVLDEAKDRMNQICNEKIMAVDEFSSQVLEKIESNHKEVVFMYNMLNEKDKDIKKLMSEPVQTGVQNVQRRPADGKEKKKGNPTAEKTPASSGRTPVSPGKTEPEKRKQQRDKSSVKPAPPSEKDVPVVQEIVRKTPPVSAQRTSSNVPGNVNLKIQKMYKEGKSILEISKELNIGQGEVKLVIALYGGNRK